MSNVKKINNGLPLCQNNVNGVYFNSIAKVCFHVNNNMFNSNLPCTPPDIKEGNKMNIENFHLKKRKKHVI
jgi:hypothetical protein